MPRNLLVPSLLALLVIGASSLTPTDVAAQAPKPMEVKSDNGAYTLVVTPKADAGSSAVLSKGNKKLWSKKLINEVAPAAAYVANSGAYVVTIDEWRKAGTHPLVIYNKKGKTVAAPTLEKLGITEDDLTKVKKSADSIWWARGGHVFFGPKAKHVIVYLRLGKFVIVELKKGRVLSGKKAKPLLEYGRKFVANEVMTDLASEKAQKRRVAAETAGRLQVKEAIPNLQLLLEDSANFRSGGKRVYYVRRAAVEALQAMGEDVGEIVTEE